MSFVTEDEMLEHRVAATFDRSMAAVFAALVGELGARRWHGRAEFDGHAVLPKTGLRFGYRQGRRMYCGEVLECLRPVSIVIVERYSGPAGAITVRQQWRLEPVECATRLAGKLTFEPNRFARLQLGFWKTHFASRAQHTCSCVRAKLRLDASGGPRPSSADVTRTGARSTRE